MGKAKLAKNDETTVSGLPLEIRNRLSEVVRQFGTQAAAAKAAGVTKTSLQRYLYGESNPSFAAIGRLTKAANVRLDWIWHGEGERERSGADAVSSSVETDLLAEAIEAVNEQLAQRNIRLSPDKQAILINEIYIHLREERRHGPQDDTRLVNLIRSMVKVAS